MLTDTQGPDFIINSTFADWWEQADKSALFLGIMIGIALGILIHIGFSWFNRKYNEHIPDYKENNDSDSEE